MMIANKDSWIRTIVLILALINQILTVLGKNPLPFSDDQIYEIFSLVFTVISGIWAWWKNNSFTAAAKEADAYMKELKQLKKQEAAR